jgi:L-asparaginase II
MDVDINILNCHHQYAYHVAPKEVCKSSNFHTTSCLKRIKAGSHSGWLVECTGKAWFCISGYVNIQSSPVWSVEKPHIFKHSCYAQ